VKGMKYRQEVVWPNFGPGKNQQIGRAPPSKPCAKRLVQLASVQLASVLTTLCGGNALAETKITLKWLLRPETTPATACLKPQMGSV